MLRPARLKPRGEFGWWAAGCCAANQAAASAVKPRTTCPQPGMAVKEAERSMVSRMKRRSAAGSGGRSAAGTGRAERAAGGGGGNGGWRGPDMERTE